MSIFKVFENDEIIPSVYPDRVNVTLSEDSACASHIAFFTGIKSIGTVSFLDTSQPSSFALALTRDVKYKWLFDKAPLAGATAERTTGVFMTTSAGQIFESSSNTGAGISHQSVYEYTKGYLYRPDLSIPFSLTALKSVTDGSEIDVMRLITIRKDLFNSTIAKNSIRLEMNLSNTSATGVVTDSGSSFTTALNLKNAFQGYEGDAKHSFFGARVLDGSLLNGAASAITIEVILRPYETNSVIFFRRLGTSGWAGTEVEAEDSFMKLELTTDPGGSGKAFRFYIRQPMANGDFEEDFAKTNVQASGLFVPADVGIDLFDGKFHHLIVTWGQQGLGTSNTSTESGAGIVMGYVDNHKLLNREQVDPRLGGADYAQGPAIQANMFDQRVPIKDTAIQYGDATDGSPTSNNIYIGISDYNRDLTATGSMRANFSFTGDANLQGGFDGQIQHLRIWDARFNDGSTGLLENSGQKIVDTTSTAYISFANFKDATLTGAVAMSGHMVAWWDFNERNTLSALDISLGGSNTGDLYGRASINLYDHVDISTPTVPVADLAASSIHRTFLYQDQPEEKLVENGLNQGRIVRSTADGTINRVGLIYYDMGAIVIDADDTNAKLAYRWPASGTTGDFGFSVTGNLNAAFNVDRLRFVSIDNKGRSIFNAVGDGQDLNYTENPTGNNPETDESLFDEPFGYVTSVGLYNDVGELLAVGKLSVPVRKDEARKLTAQVRIDY